MVSGSLAVAFSVILSVSLCGKLVNERLSETTCSLLRPLTSLFVCLFFYAKILTEFFPVVLNLAEKKSHR